MNSVLIGTHQMDTEFGLYLPEYSIPAPVPQTKFINVIGRDGAVDLSNAFGSVHYNSREWNLDFKHFDPVNWHTISSSVFNAIHGKRLDFTFDDDPNYHWTGRFIVQDYTSKNGCGTLKVRVMADPFKYKNTQTTVSSSVPVNEQTLTGDIVTINNNKAYEVNSLWVSLSPIQDLHGYSFPWPAGGGVNKLPNNATNETKSESGVQIKAENGVYTITGTPMEGNSITFDLADSVDLSPSTNKIAFLNNVANAYISVYFCRSGTAVHYWGMTSVNRVASGWTDIGNEVVNQIRIAFNTSAGSNLNITVSPMLIATSETNPTSFSPYSNLCPITGRTGVTVYVGPDNDPDNATTYTSDWTSAAGTVYGGTLDVVTGVLTVDKAYADLGTASWTKRNTSTGHWRFATQDFPCAIAGSTSTVFDCVCSQYVKLSPSATYAGNTGVSNNTSISQVCVCDERYSDKDAFTTAMSGVQLVYPLATPITYQLTPQEVELLKGTNNIWSEGQVSVVITEPIVINNPTLPVVPTVTASAPMTLRWNAQSYSMDAGTRVIPQLTLQTGNNPIYVDGEGTISFAFSEASL